jgi:UPF0716 protein FxsA
MAIFLLLLLIAFPFIEIALLIAIGRQIGVLATLALLGLAVLGGVLLIRVGGLATVMRVRAALARGEAPTEALFHAACFVIAGLLFIVPGFLSDLMALALLLLLPFRNLLKAWLWRRAGGRRGATPPHRAGPTVIEGEYETIDENARSGGSPWRRDNGDGGTLPPENPPRPPSRD